MSTTMLMRLGLPMIGILGLLAAAGADEVLLHGAESTDGVVISFGADNPQTTLERVTDPDFVKSGESSLKVSTVAPDPARGTSYIGVKLPIPPTRLDDLALSLRAWTTTPAATNSFYVRCYNAAGQQVAGWVSWNYPLSNRGGDFVLVPGAMSDGLSWETDRLKAPGDEVVIVECIAGCVTPGAPYDLIVDHVATEPIPDRPPANVIDHGLVAPVGMPTWGASTYALQGEGGRRQVFVKLWTGGNATYLFIDAETGAVEQVKAPGGGWGSYTVHFGPDQLLFDTMGDQLVLIDPITRTTRALGPIGGAMALSFTEGDDGTVYSGIYPTANIVSWSPQTGEFRSYGPLNDESWAQYPGPLTLDDSGWLYCSIGMQSAQLAALNLATGEKRLLIPADSRQRATPRLFRATDGQVYTESPGWGRFTLSGGVATPVEELGKQAGARRSATQFADGSRWVKVNVADKWMTIQDAGADAPREVTFDYASTGVNCYTMVACPDGKLRGATGIPLRIWEFDPATGELSNRGLWGYGGHINQWVLQGDRLFGAIYSDGALVQYDPSQPYDAESPSNSVNPRRVHYSPQARDLYGRPHAVYAHPDGRHIFVGGNAARVLMGSGLLIFDRVTEEGTLVDRAELLPNQGINAITAVAGGDLLIGGSTAAPTAGSHQRDATATIYRFDWQARQIVTQLPLDPPSPAVRDLVTGADGLVYGLAEPNRLLVFDPQQNALIYNEPVNGFGAVSGWQAPRCLTFGPDGQLYAIFQQAVVRIDPQTKEPTAISWPGVNITGGIAILGDRLYFSSGPRLLSCALIPPE